ncbi:helix-turn-helix transcriptional regulator [Pseudomonas sp. LS1212]|uniref:helix-turn-helix transcriptional regulator n=1 Tax=Pseudomonas sp. LS1212 TaxID=2972478 RepID=UPI00215D3537|nr:helix-turn-helix transcriptional regulator [Pseudomonas sp. LS1212]UVJ46016.1 helix-turn-helix transcriptional regulator [Pseudomonas sp. LS1212]
MISETLYQTAALDPAGLSDFLGRIYQGPKETIPWSGFLETARQKLDATFVTLVLRNPASERPGLIVNASVFGALLPGEPSYSEHYYAICPFIDWPIDRVATADEVFGQASWCEHDFYLQYLAPLDLRYILVANIRTEAGVDCAFFVCRNHQGHDFADAEKALVSVLLPHLKTAVDMHSTLDELNSERLLYAATIDRMLVGTAILDERGKVMKSNEAASRLFATRDGLYSRQDKLCAWSPSENRALQEVIQKVLQQHQCGDTECFEVIALSRPTGEMPLTLLLRPISLNYQADNSTRRPAVAVFIRDPADSPQASRRLLRKLFQLTATETEVALLMMDGLTLDEAADKLGVMKNTVRAHLRGVFAKTGATRQALLVKTLLNSVVSLA